MQFRDTKGRELSVPSPNTFRSYLRIARTSLMSCGPVVLQLLRAARATTSHREGSLSLPPQAPPRNCASRKQIVPIYILPAVGSAHRSAICGNSQRRVPAAKTRNNRDNPRVRPGANPRRGPTTTAENPRRSTRLFMPTRRNGCPSGVWPNSPGLEEPARRCRARIRGRREIRRHNARPR